MLTHTKLEKETVGRIFELRGQGVKAREVAEKLQLNIDDVVLVLQQPQILEKSPKNETPSSPENTRKIASILEQLKRVSKELGITPDELLTSLKKTLSDQVAFQATIDNAITLLSQGNSPQLVCDRLSLPINKLHSEVTKRGMKVRDIYRRGKLVQDPRTKLDVEDERNRRHAYYAGLSVARYILFKSKIGTGRMARLRSIMCTAEKYAKKSRNFSGDTVCQVSTEELFWFLVTEVQKNFPGLTPLQAFDRLGRVSGFVLTKKDWSGSFTLDNLEFIKKEEFGKRLGRGNKKSHCVESKG